MAEDKKPEVPVDMPEGKMELSLRILSNELIGIKMSVDDMKMKWVVIGVGAIALMLWAVRRFHWLKNYNQTLSTINLMKTVTGL
jgi:uncharacterized integral membrane protein